MKLDAVRWGMIGCGDVTEVKSGPAFDKIVHSKRVAVMSRTEDRVRDYARRHGISRWTTDATKLVNMPEVNAIYIATPPDGHENYTKLAAAAGKPVYVEKPMARNYEEAEEMNLICKDAGVPLFVAYYRRRLPKFLKVQELLESGAIGDVRSVSLQLILAPRPEDFQTDNLPWRVLAEISGGGYFFDLASHELDLLDYLLGPIDQASGQSCNQAGFYPAEDIVSASFRFENGILGSGVWCFTASKGNEMDRIEIIGSRGTVSFSCFAPGTVELTADSGKKQFDTEWPQHVQQPLLQTVVDQLLGKGLCPSTGDTAIRTSRIMDEIVHKLF